MYYKYICYIIHILYTLYALYIHAYTEANRSEFPDAQCPRMKKKPVILDRMYRVRQQKPDTI